MQGEIRRISRIVEAMVEVLRLLPAVKKYWEICTSKARIPFSIW
jgi:hypothetical protein